MKRDIEGYERTYLSSDFEPVQARMRKRMLLDVLSRWQSERVLEVGCGTDALFNHYRNFTRFCVVEPSSSFAARANSDAQGDDRIRIECSLMEEAAAALQGESFDAIILSGLLHEVPSCEALLEAVRGLCSQGTRLHINVPNARSFHRLLAVEMGLIGDAHEISDRQRALQQPRTFDMESLAAVCESFGFAVVDRGSYFVKPFTHSQMARLHSNGFLDSSMLDGLFRLTRHLPDLGSEIYVNAVPRWSRP